MLKQMLLSIRLLAKRLGFYLKTKVCREDGKRPLPAFSILFWISLSVVAKEILERIGVHTFR
jgi:hypothetical protein